MKKKSVWILPAFVVLLLSVYGLAGCGNFAKEKVKKEVAELNRQCPQDMGLLGELTGASYDEAENSVNFYYTVSEEFSSIEDLRQNEETMTNSMKLAFSQGEMKEISKELIIAGSVLKIHFISEKNPEDKMVLTLTTDELKDASDSKMSDSEIQRQLFENQVKSENSGCPYEVDEGMTMTSVEDNGREVVFHCKLDEKLYDIDAMKLVKDEMKDAMRESFNDATLKSQLELYASQNRGIRYEYYGGKSGKSFSIVFTPEEIASGI